MWKRADAQQEETAKADTSTFTTMQKHADVQFKNIALQIHPSLRMALQTTIEC